MHYQGNIIRPPSEADSIILQATVGCSHNKCTFCGAYKNKRFTIKSDDILEKDISFAAEHFKHTRRLFICDGDALIIPQPKLASLLTIIKKQLPWLTRIGIYANAKSLKRKSLPELQELKEMGLGIIYMGLESGDDMTLKAVNKKSLSADMIKQGKKVKQAGIKLSITVLLGLAGPERSHIHARKTGKVLSQIDPEFVGALTLMLIPGTPLYDDYRKEIFTLLEPKQMLQELRSMIVHTNLSKGLFLSNHASNFLSLKIRMPRDKQTAIQKIDQALQGNIPLKPEWMRGL
ncbi:MAG: radical SAM protein [bacterium]